LVNEKISWLKAHEWLAIALTIGVILGLACLTSLYGREPYGKSETVFPSKSYRFDVLIKGAVAYPGLYRFPNEIQMKDLLDLAGVTQNADLRRFKLNAVIKKNRIVNIPVRETIIVHFQGTGTKIDSLKIPKGTKVEDLIAMGSFTEDADLTQLRKKRKLKDNEIFTIPSFCESKF